MGRREGEQSNHLLKSDPVGWGASGRRPKPPGVGGGAAKELDRETLQNRGGAGARTERFLPPPHGVPALRSRASAKHDPLSVPVGPKQAATASSAGRRTGSSARHHRCWPPSRGRRVAGEAADARGWSRRLGEGTDPPLRGGCAAPSAPRPRALLLGHVRRLPLLSSAVRSLSSLGSPRTSPGAERQRDEGLGRSKTRVPCLRAEVLRESPSDSGWGRTPVGGHAGRTG